VMFHGGRPRLKVCAPIYASVHVAECGPKRSANERLYPSLVTLTPKRAPSNHDLPAISGRPSGRISKVAIRCYSRSCRLGRSPTRCLEKSSIIFKSELSLLLLLTRDTVLV